VDPPTDDANDVWQTNLLLWDDTLLESPYPNWYQQGRKQTDNNEPSSADEEEQSKWDEKASSEKSTKLLCEGLLSQ
jgi:hypothetical protein